MNTNSDSGTERLHTEPLSADQADRSLKALFNQRTLFWTALLALLVWALTSISAVLLPFVAGMGIAYLLDPTADKLEDMGLSRTLSVTLITAVFFIVLIIALLLILPPLWTQLAELLARLPAVLTAIIEAVRPLLGKLDSVLQSDMLKDLGISFENQASLADQAGSQAGNLVGEFDGSRLVAWLGKQVSSFWTNGLAFINLMSLLVLTPVVSFYMLRDWDIMVAKVDSWLPREQAPIIRVLMRGIEKALAGFARGQLLVALFLGVFYATGLSIKGLDFALVIGIGAGLLSFIPYVGSLSGFVASLGVGLMQYGLDSWHLGIIVAIYGAGQMIEGLFLTPKLVGDSVGLHPVWVMFALLAGGTLFGFTGILLAVPVAATIAVLLRFGLETYLSSHLYLGNDDPGDETPADDTTA